MTPPQLSISIPTYYLPYQPYYYPPLNDYWISKVSPPGWLGPSLGCTAASQTYFVLQVYCIYVFRIRLSVRMGRRAFTPTMPSISLYVWLG